MTTRLALWRELFTAQPRIILENSDFTVSAFRYPGGIEALKMENARGHLLVLPWLGQMIWDAYFDDRSLTMRNMFSQPKPAQQIVGNLRLLCLPLRAAGERLPVTGRYARPAR